MRESAQNTLIVLATSPTKKGDSFRDRLSRFLLSSRSAPSIADEDLFRCRFLTEKKRKKERDKIDRDHRGNGRDDVNTGDITVDSLAHDEIPSLSRPISLLLVIYVTTGTTWGG